jgi:hypothetical protein
MRMWSGLNWLRIDTKIAVNKVILVQKEAGNILRNCIMKVLPW